ncbi:MAG: hypothetical protein ACI4QF_05950 [Kiritimatiellia bacterium]
MKKSHVVLLSAVLVGFSTFAQEVALESKDFSTEAKEHPVTPVMVSIADPLQLPAQQVDDVTWNVSAFRWNLFYANCHEMTGFDLGLVARTGDKMTGFALETVNWVNTDLKGAQIGFLGNVVLNDAVGFQLGGLGNYVHGSFKGCQIAPFNFNGTFDGFQLGAFNWNKGVSTAFELGLANINVSELHGWSWGAVNYTERLYGLQLGVVNVVGDMGHGVQIGVFNGAARFQGVQIGVLNIIPAAPVPVLPFVNGNF